MPLRSLAPLLPGSLLVASVFLLTSCEKPFEPRAPSDLIFSIYGHLDASADTQWVRVMPIREAVPTEPGTVDAVVTLEEIETGTTVVMSDSLFKYIPVNLDGDVYAHNFSTTMPMVPGRHYRLTATRSDGASASATVLIPVFEDPTLELSNRFRFPASNTLIKHKTAGVVRGTRHLGMVLGREDVPERCDFPFPIHQEFLPITVPAEVDGDSHHVQLSWDWPEREPRPHYVPWPPKMSGDELDDRGELIRDYCNLGRKRVLVVASGDEWPHDAYTYLRELSHPNSINTIEEGGVGFLAGVQTYVFPFAGCIPIERTLPCTITFDPRSATLVGRVTNGCTGDPLDDVRVRLLSSPSRNALRYDTTDVSGVFRFDGLDPGVGHSLALTHRVNPAGFEPVELENVVLAEAAVDTVAVAMTCVDPDTLTAARMADR